MSLTTSVTAFLSSKYVPYKLIQCILQTITPTFILSSPGVEQAIKNWEGEKFRVRKFLQLPPLFQFAPIYWGHMPLLPSSLGHACCDHNESESYRPVGTVC